MKRPVFIFFLMATFGLQAQVLELPTDNRAIFEPGGEPRFYVGTVGKPWTSGTFGCVRSEGHQLHEGLDIKCVHRDRRGESVDKVRATADGVVVYMNAHPGLSTYGNYMVIRHQIDGLQIFSLYAHLREIRAGLKIGQAVKAGEDIAVMGRTAGTHEGISKERAHVHFELNLFLNERFGAWYKKTYPGQRNDHAMWNGYNLIGLDPREILLSQHALGAKFNLLTYIKQQPELCRVFVRQVQFPWLQRYSSLVRFNPRTAKEGIAGYEVALNYNGLPFDLIARTPSEIRAQGKFQLLSVNTAEQEKHGCRHLVVKRGSGWALSQAGVRQLELLTY